jgi:acetolactate synthase I/II/III large subunit
LPLGLLSEGPLFHYATIVEHPSELPTVLRRLAASARGVEGFVAHIHLPLSVQAAPAEGRPFLDTPTLPPGPAPSEEAVAVVADILRTEPCALWVGFGARSAAAEIRALAERLGTPVMCSPRGKGIFPEDHPLFLGVTGVGGHTRPREVVSTRVRRTLVLGSRLWECTSFWDPGLVPEAGFVHVDVDPAVFGAAYPSAPTLGVHAEIRAFLLALLPRLGKQAGAAIDTLETQTPAHLSPSREGLLRPRFVFEAIQRVVVEASGALVLTEAGNAFVWGTHVLRFRQPGRYRVGLHFGSMGHATTGVLGAARARSDGAVAIVGDGAMLMLEEVSTAVRYGIPAVWVVLNDLRYGIVEQGMRALGYEPVETRLPDTDFTLVARGMGALGARVDSEAELDGALRDALAVKRPFVLDVRVDPDERAPISNRIRSLEAQGASLKEVPLP